MPFDPSKPFEIVEQPEPGFDPNRQFTIVEQPPPATGFDPSKPFEIVEQPPGWLAQRADELRRGLHSAGQMVNSIALRGAADTQRTQEALAADPNRDLDPTERWLVDKLTPGGLAGRGAAARKMAEQRAAQAQAAKMRAAGNFTEHQKAIEAIPTSAAMADFQRSEGFAGKLGAVLRNPVAVPADITLNSAPAMVPGIVAGSVLGTEFGPVGTAVGAFMGSLAPEYQGKIIEVMADEGVDLKNPDSVAAFMADPQRLAHAQQLALRKGLPIAVVDAISGGFAGKILGKAMGKGFGKVAAASVAEGATQAAAGGLGEAAGELAAGEALDAGNILSEMVGEGPSAIQETATNLRHERATAAEAKRLDRWAKALAPGGAGEAEAFQQALAADNSRRGVPEPAAPEAPTTLPAAATPTQQGGAGETAAGAPSPQGVEGFENPVGAGYAPAGTFAEVDEVLAAEAAQAEAQRAETERRAQVQAYAARPLPDLVGEALRPRVAELAGKTDLEQHDFWRGMQQVAETLASAQAGRSRDLDLPAVREQAAALFSGAKPALVDAIALKLHGTKPAESVAALRDFHKYAGQ